MTSYVRLTYHRSGTRMTVSEWAQVGKRTKDRTEFIIVTRFGSEQSRIWLRNDAYETSPAKMVHSRLELDEP